MTKEQDFTCDMIEVRRVRCRYLVRAQSAELAEQKASDGCVVAELQLPDYELQDRRLTQIVEGREKYDRTASQPPPGATQAESGPRPLCGVDLSDRGKRLVRELQACVTLSGGHLSERNLLGMSLGEILQLCSNDKILFEVKLSWQHSKVSGQT